ncbi:MAG TPA: NACHT domain-containing protein [Nonomuraea sp.]|nr:NACHT domain-containing protein [Nonomuraea sp.]
MSRRKEGWRIAVTVVSVVAVGVAVVAVWRARTPDAEVNLADVVAVALAGAMLVGAMIAWARRDTPAVTPAGVVGVASGVGGDGGDEARLAVGAAARVLAGLVERQWRAEARHRLLDDPEPIPVRWRLIADETVMSQPRLITADAELTMTGRMNDIAALADAFRGLTRRRLVIAGGAGMGKTTLAIQLLLRLLATRAAAQAAAGEGEIVPVPVLLPISGWDTGVHPRLQDWLAVRLAQDYPALAAPQLGPGVAAALAESGHILPVLDGLDEILAPARAKVIAALNASLTARDHLILTSRRTEFTAAVREAGRPLTAAAVIVPQPVTPQAAADYLTACLPAAPSDAWTQTLAALRSRAMPGLTRLAATPLGLWLIRTVYLTPGADPAPLTGPLGDDADALRAHLLDRLIPALIRDRPPSADPADHFRPRHRLDPDTTRRYLTCLARAFPPAATRDIAWWRIARSTERIRSTVGRVAGLAFGLVIGFATAPVVGFGGGIGSGPWIGVLAGLVVGRIARKSWVDETPGYANLRLRGQTPRLLRSISGNLTSGRAAGIGGGLSVVLIFGHEIGTLLAFGQQGEIVRATGIGVRVGLGVATVAAVVIAVVIAIVFGLGVTLTLGLIKWAEEPTLTSTSTPRSSWRADRALILLRAALVGLMAALVFGLVNGFGKLATGLGSGSWVWPSVVPLSGLLSGLCGGLVIGRHHAWLASSIAIARLALTGQLPWRLMDFLDDAHRLGLLRAVGPVYQFRHAALHDHLAAGRLAGPAHRSGAVQ